MVGAVAGVAEELHPLVQRIAFHPAHQILDQQRHAAERTVGERAAGLGACLVEAFVDDGVELAVQLLDARDRVVDELERGGLARAYELGLGGRVEKRIGHRRAPSVGCYACTDGRRPAHGVACSSCDGDAEQEIFPVRRGDHLHADGKSRRGGRERYRHRGLAGHVERCGEDDERKRAGGAGVGRGEVAERRAAVRTASA